MEDNYSKQLYNQLNSIDPTYGKDVPFDKFQSSIKDKNYANQVYNQIVSVDPSYKKDVSFDKFYSSVAPQQEKGFLSKAWENVKSGYGIFGKPEGTPVKKEYKSQPSLLSQWVNSFSPTEKEKKQVTTGLQTLPPQTKQPKLSPLEQQQKKVDDVVNPFKEFRKFVPDPSQKSDSTKVDMDVQLFYNTDAKSIEVQEGNRVFQTTVADLKPNPYLTDYATLNERVTEFKKQKDQQVQQLLAEKEQKLSIPAAKYASTGELKVSESIRNEINTINKEYDKKIQDVEKAYQNLKENVFDPLNTQITNVSQLEYRGIKGESLDEEVKSLENAKVFTKNLNAQDKQSRLRDAASSTIKSDVLGQDTNKLDEEYTKYDNPELAGNFVTKSLLQKESKEYRGTVEQLAINRDITEGYTERRNNIVKALEEGRAKLQEDLKNNVYSKGYKITDLTPESQKSIQEQEAGFKKLENLIKLYDDNINLSKQREGILLNDVRSFTELINYKAEQDKINRLYIESPISTFGYALPSEFIKRAGSIGETASTLNILTQKKLGNISDVDAKFYLETIPEASERKIYVQKLVEDKETGQMVYKNLKDVESVSIFDEEGKYKPVGDWVENWDALGYQMFNTTAESAIIGFSGLAVRKGLYGLGRAATGRLATEMGILEAVDASTVGLSNINKAKLLGLQGLKKSATWTADVSSMLPATTFLYSPETIKGEIEKGLSVEDVALTSALRLLAETASENLFFDDVKFVDNLLKSGTVKNFTELSKSDAYRILMDKVSIATAGKGLSEVEFKTLFTGKGLKNLLTKENYEYLVKRALPQKAKSLATGIAYGVESSLLESGEEVSTNLFNTLIDTWRQSEDPKYKADQEFTLENQVNTVIQTMASMLLLGGTAGAKQARQKTAERKYNIDLAAYNVAITPDIFKENLYNQYLQSQKTDNSMSNDELSLRMKEIDRIGQIYKSLGFSQENTEQNIKLQLEKLTKGKTEVDDVLNNELLKQAEREVRNTEFQTFREALTKSDLENQFLSAKTDEQKEKLVEEIDKAFDTIQNLKNERRIQNDNFLNLQKTLSQQEYSEERTMLSKVVQNIDSFVSSLETLDEIDELLAKVQNYEDTTDETIKDYATIISTALKNRQYELLEQGETRLTPEELAEKEQFESNNFSKSENNIIQSLGINPEDIIKQDGKIIYSHEGQPIEFNTFKDLISFQNKKAQEKQEQIKKAEQDRFENQQIQELSQATGLPIYKTTAGKFGIDVPNEEPIEFSSLEELENYILNPKPVEEVQQDNLDTYETEVNREFEKYKKGKKKPLSKDKWLKTKAAQKVLAPIKQKYGIKQEDLPVEVVSPLKTEMSENEVTQINDIANMEHLSVPGITYENLRLVFVSNLISYQARAFEERTEIDEETGNRYVIEESVNELNKEFEFIHSPNFKEGQEFTVVIQPFENSPFVEQEKETLRKNNAKYLIEQGISQEEINQDLNNDNLFREIQIFDKENRYVGAIHSLSYVRPDRVVSEIIDEEKAIPNLAPNYKELKELRNSILSSENKDVKLILSSKSPGWLSIRVNNENKVLKEAFKNQQSLSNITVLSKTSTLRIAGKETVNKALQGSTVIPIITPNGNYFALTLNKTKLHKLQVDSVINAIQLHSLYNKLINTPSTELSDDDIKALKNLNDLAENFLKETEHDIRTPQGVKNYIQLFVNANSKTSDYYTSAEKKSLQDVPFIDIDTDSKGNFRITFSNQRIFLATDPNLKPGKKEALRAIGIYRYTLEDLMQNPDLSILREHLQKRTINHSTTLVQSNKKFNLPYLKKTNLASNPYINYPETELGYEGLTNNFKNYKDFIVSTSLTPVIETALPDGTYSYFQQPNLAFETDITEKKAPEPIVEEQPTETPQTQEVAPTEDIEAKEAAIERSKIKETVYHGTGSIFNKFDKNKLGEFTGAVSAKLGFFFTDDRAASDTYAQLGNEKLALTSEELKDKRRLELSQFEVPWTKEEDDRYESYLEKIKKRGKGYIKNIKLISENPYIIDLEGADRTEGDFIKIINKAKKEGYDAVIIKNTKDDPVAEWRIHDVYIVFEPEQIIELTDAELATLEQPKEEIVEVYQGRKEEKLENREFEYFALTEEEAKQYGENIRTEQVDLNGFLFKILESKEEFGQINPEYTRLFTEFQESTGKVFDILNNSKEGLGIQAEFFNFLKNKGYKGFSTYSSGFIKNKISKNPKEYDDKYIITFNKIEQKPIITPEIQDKTYIENNIDNSDTSLNSALDEFESMFGDDVSFQKVQNISDEGIIASEKTIRDLAARMSDRIGIPYKIISDRTQEFKGKIENNTAIVNLAYATLDTPIHEILGHPIIRAIKYSKNIGGTITLKGLDTSTKKQELSQLYQNLLKELEYGKGKEVLDRIKRDYVIKDDFKKNEKEALEDLARENNWSKEKYQEELAKVQRKYTLEEQQEEAIVELLGMMTAEKLDAVKDGKLISLLKRLLKEMKQFVRSLLSLKEVEINKLPDNMTIGDIADLLAYSNSKLILPGYEVEYTTPDNMKFKTYAEASNHISQLVKSIEEVDLSEVKIEKKTLAGEIDPITGKKIKSAKFKGGSLPYFSSDDNQYEPGEPDSFELVFEDDTEYTVYSNDLFRYYDEETRQFYDQIRPSGNSIESFIESNKEYEQSKEVIEEWKKVNNIQYNPEEVYSRGQEFVSVVGAYSSFDVNLMMQNLLSHIEDNEKAGGEFTISAFTKPVDRQIGHLEGGGGKIKFKIYPKSNDILWAANTDVYSGSVWDASEKISKDKKSELLGVSYTKYPSLSNVNAVQPNLANIVDDLAHHHNELGIVLTGNNFRLEYDDDIPYSTKKIINSVNSILDSRYGKVVKPGVKTPKKSKYIEEILALFDAQVEVSPQKIVIDGTIKPNKFLLKGYSGKLFNTIEEAEEFKQYQLQELRSKISNDLDISLPFTPKKEDYKNLIGIQPTQTNETLKESIESIKNKLKGSITDEYGTEYKLTSVPVTQFPNNKIGDVIKLKGYDYKITAQTAEQEDWDGSIEPEMWKIEFVKIDSKKEYTSQALINTRIAALKEVAKKYPRSLIRSEVKPIFGAFVGETFIPFDKDELPFQKIPTFAKSKENIIFTSQENLDKLPDGKPC